MSMKITVPWLTRIATAKSRPPRKDSNQPLSEPLRSVTMREDDLDHLGALHHVIEQKNKPKRFGKWF